LSFAQFEREVIGERIRDKIAASKKKGMWMGGVPPLGYGGQDHKLVTIDDEADTVRLIFRRYAELGSVRLLKAELEARGIKSKWLFVQSAVGPFDRLLEASRSEMREHHAGSAEIARLYGVEFPLALFGSHETLRWREPDSNPRSLSEGNCWKGRTNRFRQVGSSQGDRRFRIRSRRDRLARTINRDLGACLPLTLNGSPVRSSLDLLDHVMVRAPRSRRTGRKGVQVSRRAKVCFGRTAARVVFLLSPGGLNWDQSRPIASTRASSRFRCDL
jgi:hypothetical protein